MEHLHRLEVVHGDLRPENIFVQKNLQIKISGFFLFSNRKYRVEFPKVPFMGGSPEYWSPEQANHYNKLKEDVEMDDFTSKVDLLSNLTEKIDVYSFGLIVWEMIQGYKEWITGEEGVTFRAKLLNKGNKLIFLEKKHQLGVDISLYQELQSIAIKCLNLEESLRPSFGDLVRDIFNLSLQTVHYTLEPLWQETSNSQGSEADRLNNQAVAFLGCGEYELASKLWKEVIKTKRAFILSF